MATTQIAFGVMGGSSPSGGDVQAMRFETTTVCTALTPSGTSQMSSAAAPATLGATPVCRIATDTAVYVTFGETPTAASSNGLLVPANAVEYLLVTAGHKAAVITI